jgi:methylisocitrate lyase
MSSRAQRLRDLIEREGCIAVPGAFNALCAKAVAQAGFPAVYVSGAATSVSAGVPDVGLVGCEHFCRLIRELDDACGLPVIADADTGFGEAEMVRRTVIEYARAGAAALHIEDQQFPKRCGHLDGKALVPADHMIEKVQWAAKAARELGEPGHPGIVLIARTDARGVEGFDAAVERAAAYCQAGAEMIFPEGLASIEEFAEFARRLRARAPRALLLANMTEFGKTPILHANDFAKAGYNVVIYPVSLLRVAMGAVTGALAQLRREGSVAGFIGQMQTRQQLYDLVQYKPGVAWEFPVRAAGQEKRS